MLPANYPGAPKPQASPCIRFNKEGILLAVSTNDNNVKILANAEGIRLLRTVENRTFDASRVASAAVVKVSQDFELMELSVVMFSKCIKAYAGTWNRHIWCCECKCCG